MYGTKKEGEKPKKVKGLYAKKKLTFAYARRAPIKSKSKRGKKFPKLTPDPKFHFHGEGFSWVKGSNTIRDVPNEIQPHKMAC